jgi:hypothetical protein
MRATFFLSLLFGGMMSDMQLLSTTRQCRVTIQHAHTLHAAPALPQVPGVRLGANEECSSLSAPFCEAVYKEEVFEKDVVFNFKYGR